MKGFCVLFCVLALILSGCLGGSASGAPRFWEQGVGAAAQEIGAAVSGSDEVKLDGIDVVKAAKTLVYVTNTGDCYHKKGCRYLKSVAGSMTETEANQKGYRACKSCCGN